MATCAHCSLDYFTAISKFFNNQEASLEFLRDHGVIPKDLKCPKCGGSCTFREEDHLWRCRASFPIPKSKKRRLCNFSSSDYKGTFLSGSNIPAWKIVCFVNHFISKHWDHETVSVCLGLSKHTVVDWRSFCSEVTDEWYRQQAPIGGPGVVVEIDETLITRRKYNRGRLPTQIWLFGGIERVSKRKFIVPLTGDVAAHRKNFVDPEDPNVHTQNIERLWKDVKSWVKRPGIRSKYLYQYLGRYLFAKAHEPSTLLHHFFVQAAKLYPPQSDRSPTASAEQSDSSSETDSDAS
ncbi:hypothetical protein EGW08_020777 [Elysia chlorotica]|uniref:ISXO2-like transposase domain-containing protein n=1 Tax=Elysia chlorotica TaxID=188477 RepID=A0A433SQD4_ELYCH|nr:hypothetical protein EGW08_020777 [Elysia chlorotica]